MRAEGGRDGATAAVTCYRPGMTLLLLGQDAARGRGERRLVLGCLLPNPVFVPRARVSAQTQLSFFPRLLFGLHSPTRALIFLIALSPLAAAAAHR